MLPIYSLRARLKTVKEVCLIFPLKFYALKQYFFVAFLLECIRQSRINLVSHQVSFYDTEYCN